MVRTMALLLGLIAAAAASAVPANERTVEGMVVDAVTRKPLAGAVVELVSDRSVQARTDARGLYRLPQVRVPVPGVPMKAAAEGYFSAVERIPPAAGGGARALPLFALSPASSLSGRVMDEAGRPLAGADVRVFVDPVLSTVEQKPHQTRTGPGGRFRVTGLATGTDHLVRVARPGFAPEILALSTPSAGPLPEVRLTLRRGRTATGLLVDAAGKPAPGVTIKLVRDPASPEDGRHRADLSPYQDTTGPDGRFEIRDLPADRFKLFARIPREPVVELAHSVDIPEGPGRTDLGRQTLPPREVLEGRIFDSEGRPLEGVQVWTGMGSTAGDEPVLARHRAAGPAAVTDPDGRFSLRSLDPRSGLWLCRAGFEPLFVQMLLPRDLSRLVLHPPAARLPGARVSGRVVDTQGRPVPGVLLRHGSFHPPGMEVIACGFTIVEMNPCKEGEDAPPPDPVSDAGGRFSFEVDLGGAESSSVDVWTEAEGFLVSVRPEVPLAAGQTAEIELVLRPGAILAGRIFGPGGLPAAGAEISARGEQSRSQTVADAEGNYRLEGIDPGQGVLTVRHREHGQAHRKIAPALGENRLDVTLDGKGMREIRGRVLGPGGEPLAGVLVDLRHPDVGARAAYTAGDGSFVLDYHLGAAEGPIPARVEATAKGYRPAVETVVLAGSPVNGLELRMEKGLAITGRLLGLEPDQDPRSVSVQARRGGDSRPGAVDAAGNYRIEDLGPGRWEVTASAAPWKSTGRVDLNGFSGGAVLDLEVPRLHEVRGRTIGPDGAPVQGVRVLFQPFPPGPAPLAPSGFSAADGSFTLRLPEGLYEVIADAQGLSRTRLEQPLEVDAPISDLEVRLQTGTVLRGLVRGLRPGHGKAKISANSGLAARWADTAPDGRYRLPDLGPGEWTVTAMLHQERVQRMGEGRIRIQPGELDAMLDLDLALGDLTLSLTFLSGDEPISASLTLAGADTPVVLEGAWLDNEDSFQYTGLRPGRYRLQIQDNLHDRQIEREIDLTSDQEVVVDLREDR